MKSIEKYLAKRNQIIGIIESMNIDYETIDCMHTVSPDVWSARICAEKILSKFGISKPEHLKQNESDGSMFRSVKGLNNFSKSK